MQLIDTHAHIYDAEFSGQTPNVCERFFSLGGRYMIMPNIDSESIIPMIEMHKKYPKHTGMLLGLHPCYVRENYAEQLRVIFEYLDKQEFKGIGEIGLDQIQSSEYAKPQEQAFRAQLELAASQKLPISIHARASTKECLHIIKEDYVPAGLTGVFHCFSDDYDCAKKAIDMGFYLGIGGFITFKKAENLREVVEKIGLDFLVLETDTPYLAPVPLRGKTNEPAYLHYIVEVLKNVLKRDTAEIAQKTTQNARNLFAIEL